MVLPHRNRLKELHRYPQHSHIEMAGPEAAPRATSASGSCEGVAAWKPTVHSRRPHKRRRTAQHLEEEAAAAALEQHLARLATEQRAQAPLTAAERLDEVRCRVRQKTASHDVACSSF